ncbi:hypothetical protein CHS0354_013293 [Potamilus streckersoni]|uniref:SUMO-activating enzyme subunit 1 n=1 Tax=Potamilus streckersoni TaxID=2493646 RepID=A0AAE0W3P1_9BIVA|nr:hypothetical protein CHS0354_013293 [Potamilus streckersoni]
MAEQLTITEDEAALYDRQIRLWGLDAQRRLRASRVLLIGLRGLGAEVAKNIVLAGIKSLTLLDHTVVTEEDACSQFLVPRQDVGKNRAEASLHRVQQLNPMVDVQADASNVEDKPDDYFLNYDVVCATCCTQTHLKRIDEICAAHKIKFFAGDVFGFYGYMFADLGFHEYAEDVQKPKVKENRGEGEPATKKARVEELETHVVKKSATFTRLSSAFEYDWGTTEGAKKLKRTPSTFFIIQVLLQFMEKFSRRPEVKTLSEDRQALKELTPGVLEKIGLKPDYVSPEFARSCFAELSPVCAIVGGVLGQEIIKAVSQKDPPHKNFFFFDGIDGSGLVDQIGD